MDLREEASKLVLELGKKLKLKDDLVFDEEDTCIILLDNKIPVLLELSDDTNCIVFNAVLGKIPTDKNREEILSELLAANFYWCRTEGATIGLDEETDFLGLFYLLPFPLEDDSDFELVFTKLANLADYWIDHLNIISPPPDFFKNRV